MPPQTLVFSSNVESLPTVEEFSVRTPSDSGTNSLYDSLKESIIEAPKEREPRVKVDEELGVTMQKGDTPDSVFTVPFYSQFSDITATKWQKVGCGIASLAMLIDFYEPKAVTVDELLQEGIDAGAYQNDAGWSHAGLIGLSKKYGLNGESHDLGASNMDTAFATLKDELEKGPVMASVHYTFSPTNPIPHLVVVNGVSDGMVFYNDPAEKAGGHSISIAKFQGGWKKRYIDIRPVS